MIDTTLVPYAIAFLVLAALAVVAAAWGAVALLRPTDRQVVVTVHDPRDRDLCRAA